MSIEAMKQWLAALENASEYIQAEHDQRKEMYEPYGMVHKYSTEVQNLLDNKQAITSLRQAIEQAEKQEPVCDTDPRGCWSVRCQLGNKCKNTPAPQREWVGLTDEEIALVCAECAASAHNWNDISFARAIEAKLKQKNGSNT